MTASVDHAGLMDRIYRFQRRFGFYDATRKYYLLGRDPMIEGLNVPAGGTVLEIGCGTGRNLVMAGRRYPTARLFGVDISREMLAAAGDAVLNAGLAERARLAFADAAEFDPRRTFGRGTFDRIYLSYAVSMIPQWRQVMQHATRMLAPGGELHVVDFGDLRDRPDWQKRALYTWLRWYHVTPRPDLFDLCEELAERHGCTARRQPLYGGFTWIATIARPDRLLQPVAESLDEGPIAA